MRIFPALLQTNWMCSHQERSCERKTPRYLYIFTSSRGWPSSSSINDWVDGDLFCKTTIIIFTFSPVKRKKVGTGPTSNFVNIFLESNNKVLWWVDDLNRRTSSAYSVRSAPSLRWILVRSSIYIENSRGPRTES